MMTYQTNNNDNVLIKILSFALFGMMIVASLQYYQLDIYKSVTKRDTHQLQDFATSCESGDCVVELKVRDRNAKTIPPLCKRGLKVGHGSL